MDQAQPVGVGRRLGEQVVAALDGGREPYLLIAPLAPELIDVLDRLA